MMETQSDQSGKVQFDWPRVRRRWMKYFGAGLQRSPDPPGGDGVSRPMDVREPRAPERSRPEVKTLDEKAVPPERHRARAGARRHDFEPVVARPGGRIFPNRPGREFQPES